MPTKFEVRFETPWGNARVWSGRAGASGSGVATFISDNVFVLLEADGRAAYLYFDNPVPREAAHDWCDAFLRARLEH